MATVVVIVAVTCWPPRSWRFFRRARNLICISRRPQLSSRSACGRGIGALNLPPVVRPDPTRRTPAPTAARATPAPRSRAGREGRRRQRPGRGDSIARATRDGPGGERMDRFSTLGDVGQGPRAARRARAHPGSRGRDLPPRANRAAAISRARRLMPHSRGPSSETHATSRVAERVDPTTCARPGATPRRRQIARARVGSASARMASTAAPSSATTTRGRARTTARVLDRRRHRAGAERRDLSAAQSARACRADALAG
jgi:hypothetical protein